MINQILQYQIPITDTYSIGIARMILALLVLIVLYFVYRFSLKIAIRKIRVEEGDIYERKMKSIFKYFFLIVGLYILALGLRFHNFSILSWINSEFSLNWDITKEGLQVFKVGSMILGFIIIQLARFFDLMISRLLQDNEESIRNTQASRRRNMTEMEVKRKTNLTIQYTVYGVALVLFLNIFKLDATIFSNTGTADKPGFTLEFSDIAQILVIVLLARLLISMLTNVFLRRVYRSQSIDQGRQYSFNQLLSYFIYVVAVLFAIKSLGYNMTLIFGGFAALLVGIGLGLQQTFNDFFSGIILLFEHSVEVGNILEVDDEEFGEVEKIGLRTSVLRDRNNVMRIIPNSLIVNGTITNMSHMDYKSRFFIELGVAYDTDLPLLKKIMLEVVSQHEDVLKYPQPQVMFDSISASTFNFRLYFWSTRIMSIRMLSSELRWELINLCRVHHIEVAYEQYDIRFRNSIVAEQKSDKGINITPLSPDRDFTKSQTEE